MSTGVEKGAALYNRRYERGTNTKPPTREEVKDSSIAAGMARWQAMHATKPIIGPDGSFVRRPDHEARAAARALLSPEGQAEVDARNARSGVGSYDDLADGQRMSVTPAT